jgi:hypothetical protein
MKNIKISISVELVESRTNERFPDECPEAPGFVVSGLPDGHARRIDLTSSCSKDGKQQTLWIGCGDLLSVSAKDLTSRHFYPAMAIVQNAIRAELESATLEGK